MGFVFIACLQLLDPTDGRIHGAEAMKKISSGAYRVSLVWTKACRFTP